MKLRELRKRAGLKPSELASKMAVDITTISRWETGTRKPDVDSLVKLSKILNCTVDDLVNPTLSPAGSQAQQGTQ